MKHFQEGVITRDEDRYFLTTTDRRGRSNDDGENVILKLKSDTPKFRETAKDKTFSDLMDLDILSSVLKTRSNFKSENERNFDKNAAAAAERSRKSSENNFIEMAVFVDEHLFEKLRQVFSEIDQKMLKEKNLKAASKEIENFLYKNRNI